MIVSNKSRSIHRKPVILIIALVCAVTVFTALANAQSPESPWNVPANVSRSGAASQSELAASPDGTLHAVWWDPQEGEQYAYTTDISGTIWTIPVTVPEVFGRREEDPQTKKIIISAPREVRLAATTDGRVYAFWITGDAELRSAQIRTDGWGEAVQLAESVSAIEVEADSDGALHLAYVRSIDTAESPAGIYYYRNRNGNWSDSALVYASSYFRAIKPENIQISVAGNNAGQALLAWDDPQLGQSMYARSDNGGATWSEPQAVTGSPGTAKQARVASALNGEFLLIWQDASSGGCSHVQRRSSDGGTTWTAPEKVLSALAQCDLAWRFMPASERLWLIGRPMARPENSISELALAVWDGAQWSVPATISLSFFDAGTNRTINLNCLNAYLNGEVAGVLGCDPASDVWATRNKAPLNELVPQLQPVWSALTPLSDRSVPAASSDLPALATNDQGVFFALWSQDAGDGNSDSALYASAGEAGRWTRTARVLESLQGSSGPTKAIQPALAMDAQDKAHAVWSSGTNGRIHYSWTYARDFNVAEAWVEPIELPAPSGLSSWPDITADPRSNQLYVVYAVPLNEQRGIYLARSDDGGTTWLAPTVILDAVVAQWDSVDEPRIALDPANGTLHVTWLRKLPQGGVGPQFVYYARSADQGKTWSAPLLVARGDVDWPRIAVSGSNQVYLAWNEYVAGNSSGSATPMTVRGQYSPDGGKRWTAPTNIDVLKQVSGPIGLTGDGTGRLYITAIGKSSSEESTLFNAEWNGQDWEERPALALRQQAMAGNTAVVAVAPGQGKLTALLRQSIWNMDGATQVSIDTTDRTVEARPMVAAPTFTPQPTPTAQATVAPQPTATLRPPLDSHTQQPASDSGGANPLILGSVLAAIIVVAAVARTIWVRRR
jgi:hypothetical protein